MTPLWQFWTDWAVKALATLGTFLAVLVALFGSWLRNWIWPPRLTIGVANREGYSATLFIFDKEGKTQHQTSARWYHVRTTNETRWNPVTELYVFLLLIEQPDAASNFQPTWVGQAALTWRNEANPQPKKLVMTPNAISVTFLRNR